MATTLAAPTEGTLTAGSRVPDQGDRVLVRERSRVEQLERSVRMGVLALAGAVEARCAVTGAHSKRVVKLALAVLNRLDRRSSDDPSVELGYLLHDVGKIAIPDRILLKEGPLTQAEELVMRQHPLLGVGILQQIPCLADPRVLEVVRHHHERWDGLGYPAGLAGTDVPVSCRAFGVVDAFDAMTSDRPYRSAFDVDTAMSEVRACAGTQFDPSAVRALGEILGL